MGQVWKFLLRARRCTTLAATTAFVAVACQADPVAPGEALLVVSTDVDVPQHIDRVRIEVFDDEGDLVDFRELPTPHAEDWPLSASIVSAHASEHQVAWIRVRGFRDVAARVPSASTLAGSRPAWTEPLASTSLDDACARAPELEPGQSVTLRRGDTPITTMISHAGAAGVTCTQPTRSGSVAARIRITERGPYRVAVTAALPNPERHGPGGDATLALRTACEVPTTQLACADGPLPELDLELAPGTYWMVTGGRDAAYADLTLSVTRRNSILPAVDAEPILDETSAATTIDRLVAVRLEPGRRGTYEVALHGDCFGTMADVRGKRSCTTRSRTLDPVVVEDVGDALTRESTVRVGTWPAITPQPCTAPPRPNGPAKDGEVCVSGGVFTLGDDLALSDGDARAQPQRVRVVAPFLMDTFEVTVGRFRQALRDGFLPPRRDDPVANPGQLTPDAFCTWNVGAESTVPAPGVDREAFPLNCISWELARAVCHFWKGDLPTEDQWEYAATAAGRGHEESYPWGNEPPDCERAVIARRMPQGVPANDVCATTFGPTRVDDPSWAKPGADFSPNGIVGLAGNLSEWTSSSFLPYTHPAWEDAGLDRAILVEEHAPIRTVRGGSWLSDIDRATGSTRLPSAPVPAGDIGFRCVRAGR